MQISRIEFVVYTIALSLIPFGCQLKNTSSGIVENVYFTFSENKNSDEFDTCFVKESIQHIKLVPLAPDFPYTRLDIYSEKKDALKNQKVVYQNILQVNGKSENQPQFVIYAEWKITDITKTESFIKSRLELFNLRKELLENFSFDILAKNLNTPDQYLIVGFYKSEEGLEQARNHPVIKEWAKNNPPAKFSATDLFTPKRFRINSN